MKIDFGKKSNRRGMTLVEMLVAVAIGMVVLAAVGKLTLFTARSFVALGDYNDLDKTSQNALDVMSRDIRQATNCVNYGTNFLSFDGGSLVYTWNPTTRKLIRIKNYSTVTVLLQQCDYLLFGVSQRNPTNNFFFYKAVSPSEVKLVDVSWKCSRQMVNLQHTESVQTAKIVMRN